METLLRRMYPAHLEIIGIILRNRKPKSYSEIAEELKLPNESVLAHLDDLEDRGLIWGHFGKPSRDDPGTIQKCYEATNELQGALKKLQKYIENLTTIPFKLEKEK